MKKFLPAFLSILLLIATSIIFLSGCKLQQENEYEENEEYDGPDKAAEFQFNRTKDPATGTVPQERFMEALEQTIASRNIAASTPNSPNSVTALTWIERGSNSDVTGASNNNTRANGGITSGRVDAIMVDSSDATHKTVWIGGRDGGLWKTTDITASPSTWTLINDNLSNLSISAICQDPTNLNTMYFCTGESYFEGSAVQGNGIFKSTDHGITWAQLPSTVSYTYSTRILCDYLGNVYLATRGNGLLRSNNGGTSWTNITPTGMSNRICDLEISSTSVAARLHVVAGIFSTQSYRYTDVAETATTASGWNAPATAFATFSQRAEIGVSGNTLYAAPANASYQVPTIYKSVDGGANWAATAGQPTSGWASGQGWYALTVGINPSNPNECIVGGLDNYKTTNGGTSWTKISAWVGTTGQYVHADQHTMLWYDGGSKLIFGCDGGIHYSSDGGTTSRDRNVGLRLKQFYSVAVHPTTTNYFLAGAQDNGVHQFNNPGLSSSVEVTGGDGAIVAIDQDEPQFQIGSYVYSNFRRSSNSGASWSSGPSNNTGQFINPFDYDNLNNKVYAGTGAGQYLRWDNPQTGFTYTNVSVAAFNSSSVSAAFVSPFTANRVYFGTVGGRIVQVDNANTATPTEVNLTGSGMTGYANCVVTGSDDQHLMAVYANYGVTNIWVSSNGGTTWTGVDGNLPDMPVYWALYHPDDNNKAYIATETGVWETDNINGGATVWTASSSFPAVRCNMIKYRSSDRTIAAATFGRGLWTATIPSVTCTPASIVTQPASVSVCTGVNATFTVVAAGTAPLSYQWQLSTNGGVNWSAIAGANTATLSFPATTGLSGNQYRCVVTGNCVPLTVTSSAAMLNVNTGPSITTQPVNRIICAGISTTFSIAGAGTGIGYQWQVSTDGGVNFVNLTNGGTYSGATTNTLALTNVPFTFNGNQYRCTVSNTCANTATSNAVTLTVNAVPAVTTQPVAVSVCAGNTASFSVTATGGSLNYQWQVSVDGGATFTNIGGATSATYNFATVIGQNGNQYRCMVTGSCAPPATSNAATLTVGTSLVVSTQPANKVVCEGSSAIFTVGITGTVISYQWQLSVNGGGAFTNIGNNATYSGTTTGSLTLSGITASMNNYQYRVIVTGSCPPINSNAAVLTVNTAPVVTTQAVASTICSGGNTSFTVAATGTALTYQWQGSTDGCTTFTNLSNSGNYNGVTTPTLNITGAAVSMNGTSYRAVVSGTCTPVANSNCALLTVNTPISISAAPQAATICATGTTSFAVTATGTSPTYQWQVSTNAGTSYSNISNGAIYSGATTAMLTLSNVTTSMNTYLYRVIVSGASPCGSVTSFAAALSVSAQPTVILTASPYTKLLPGLSTTITATVNPSAGFTTVWKRNGAPITVTGNSLAVDVNGLGTYTVVATIGSCVSTEASITISDSASNRLFIFPSPNDGRFKIAYYNQGGNSVKQHVTIFDAHGARVLSNDYLITQAYQLIDIDMRREGTGLYYVVLTDGNGKRIATGEVLVR